MSEVAAVEVVMHGKRVSQHDLYAHLMTAHNEAHGPDLWPDEPAEMAAAHREAHRELRRMQKMRRDQVRDHCPGCRCQHREWDATEEQP